MADEDIPMGEAPAASTPNSALQRRSPTSQPEQIEVIPSSTVYCYDKRMMAHATISPEDDHPEDPRRISEIYNAFCREGLIYDKSVKNHCKKNPFVSMVAIHSREATVEEIELVHTTEHLEFLRSTQAMSDKELNDLTDSGDSVYFNKKTYECAKLSCGSAIETCKAVVSEKYQNGFAIIRPPGHHAEPDCSGGFCHLNNVAVAARSIKKLFGLERIMILDWDVHHGNGTQSAFYDDPSVLYMSIHRWEEGSFYPTGPEGGPDRCGEGPGLGYNVNIPWPCGGMGDGDYLYAFNHVVMPIAQEFNPDFVIVSAGFDAAAGDRIGECLVTPNGYAHMIYQLKSLANGRIAVILEGGYNLKSIANSAVAVGKILMGGVPERIRDLVASPAAAETVDRVIKAQGPHWGCFRHHTYHLPTLVDQQSLSVVSLDEVIRKYQTEKLRNELSFHVLPTFDEKLTKDFDNHALASPEFYTKDVLVVIFHDDPKVYPLKNIGSDKLAPTHEVFVVEEEVKFVHWSVNQGFGVIDINVPRKIYSEKEKKKVDTPESMMNACGAYFWDNYVSPSDAKKIILMGIGDAAQCATYLLAKKHEEMNKRIIRYFSFTDIYTKIKPVVSKYGCNMQYYDWFTNHSSVYLSKDHAMNRASSVPSRYKYGNLIKVDEKILPEMIKAKTDAVKEQIISALKPQAPTPLGTSPVPFLPLGLVPAGFPFAPGIFPAGFIPGTQHPMFPFGFPNPAIPQGVTLPPGFPFGMTGSPIPGSPIPGTPMSGNGQQFSPPPPQRF